jgi:putative colanic acid biosynthesis acetyltransferase WcaF
MLMMPALLRPKRWSITRQQERKVMHMRDEDIRLLWNTRSRSPVARRIQLRRLLWSWVEATLYRHSFHTANRWRGFLLRLFGARVGECCTIRKTSRVYYPWNLTMGSLSCLGDDVVVYDLGPVTLGDRVTISQEAYLCAGTHDFRLRTMPLLTPPIEVKDDAWICARAFVGPGVTVGEGAVVGAAAVAMKNVEAWTVVAGNPAQKIGKRDRPS